MNSLEGTAIMAALFAARIALPVALTIMFGLFMNYLLNRGMVE